MLEVHGMRGGMRVRTLHKVIGMKCDKVCIVSIWFSLAHAHKQEILRYLRHIKNVWHKILRVEAHFIDVSIHGSNHQSRDLWYPEPLVRVVPIFTV